MRQRTPRHRPGRRPGRGRASLGRVVGLVVVAVGIPVGLIAVAQLTLASWHPLPGVGSWDEIRTWLRRELSSSRDRPDALRVLLGAAWLLWLGLLVSVLSSIVTSRPTLERLRLPRLAMFDGLGGWIAAGLTALSSLTPNLAPAGGDTVVAAAVAEVSDATVTVAPTRAAHAPAPGRVGWDRVRHGESIEMFAARTLHAAERWPEVWELNQHRVMDQAGTRWTEPWRLAAGWELELPADHTAESPGRGPTGDGPRRSVTADDRRRLGADDHVVVSGDTLWALSSGRLDAAGLAATDEMILDYVNDVVAANPELDDPDLIFPGQRLVLPAIRVPPRSATAGANPPTAVAADEPLVHVFVAGETLWDVLHAYHGHVDADLIWAVAERNGLENPSDIAVGTAVTIAWPPKSPPAPPATDGAEPDEDVAAPRQPVEVDVEEPPPPGPTPPPITSPAPQPAVAAADPPVSAPADPPPPANRAVEAAAAVESSPRSLWWQVPAGLLLAAGLTSMTRRLRSRRLARLDPGDQLAPPPDVAAGTELAVSAGRPLERLSTLQSVLRTVTPYAREQADPPPVRAVQIGEDRIEVLFAEPAPFPPPGWSTVDGGVSWVHLLDGSAAPSVRQLVTPALVTVGVRADGGELLLDLETAGSLAITGDRAAGMGVARAMALEVATYPLGVAMDLCTIGFDVDGVEHCDRAWTQTTLSRATRVARETLERTAATGAASLLAARARTDDDEALLDPQIFIVDAAAVADGNGDLGLLDELVELCTPQSGAAVVMIGDHPQARERIEIRSAGEARWCGAELRPVVLDRETVAQAAVMLDHAANAPAEALKPSPVLAERLAAGVELRCPGDADGAHRSIGEADGGGVGCSYEPPDHDVLVQVLGDVAVHGRPVTGAAEIELLTLLTFMRDTHPSIDTITNLLARRHRPPGRDGHGSIVDDDPLQPATLLKRLSILRAKLGVGADGTDLLPSAKTARGVPGRYTMSPRVLTDVDLIEDRYHTASRVAVG